MPAAAYVNKILVRKLRTVAILNLFGLLIYSVILSFWSIFFDNINDLFVVPNIVWISLVIIFIFWLRRALPGKLMPASMFIYNFTFGMYLLTVAGFRPIMMIFLLFVLVINGVLYGKRGIILGIFILAIFTALTGFLDTDAGMAINEYLITGIVDIVAISAIAVALVVLFRNAGISEDIFRRVETEGRYSKDQLVATINSLPIALISVNKNGLITDFNAAALDLLDTNVGLTGHKAEKFLVFYNKTGEKKLKLANLVSEKINTYNDLTYKYANGELINIKLSIAPIYNSGENKSNGFVFLLSDITKEKSLEEQQQEFISVVSHELRTPAAIAEGAISNLNFLIDRGSETKQLKEQADSGYNQIVYLEKLINDISVLSKTERGEKIDIEQVNINELLTEMEGKYRDEAAKNGLKLLLELPKEQKIVETSTMYLQEIMQNLISNAIKYTKHGGVKIVATIIDNKQITISVADSGVGISRSDQHKIWDKFFRSEDFRTRETSGTGLGLYIVAKLAKLINTTVSVKSELNKGSVFSFSLPIKEGKK